MNDRQVFHGGNNHVHPIQPAAAEDEPGAEGDPHPGAPEVDPALEPDQLPVEDHPGRGDDGDDPGGGDGDPGGNRHNIGNRLSICSCLNVGNLMYQFYFSFNFPFF